MTTGAAPEVAHSRVALGEDDRVRFRCRWEGSVPARWGSGDGDSSHDWELENHPIQGADV